MRIVTIFSIILIQLCSGCYNDSYPTYDPTPYYHPTSYTKEISCDACGYIYKMSEFSPCLSCAKRGNAKAAYGIARVYENGSFGVEKDLSIALQWYKTAADLGHETALRVVFDSYYFGKCGPENKELAWVYLEKAANEKHEWAMLLLAKWSEDNESEKAIELYSQAAQNNNRPAQTRLAEIYFDGKIVPQNICKSYFWALLARAGGANSRVDIMSETYFTLCHWLFYSNSFAPSAFLISINWSGADSGNDKRAYADANRIKVKAEKALCSEHIQLVQNSATVWQKGQIEPEFPIIQIEQTKEPTFVKISPPESMTISKSLTTDISIEWVAAAIDLNSQLKKDLTPAQVFDLLNPSVWAVISAATKENLKAMNNVSLGSAVVISNNKLLTNWHVVEKKPYVLIKHGEQFVEANIYAGDKQTDRCILSVENIELKPVKAFRKYDSLSIGEAVYSIGSPQGLENTLGQGIISGKRELDESMIIQTTAQVSPGSSGGGLFDSYGNLIGITTFKVIESEGLNFAIPVEDFTR